MKTYFNKYGFSLVELMVALALLSIVLAVGYNFYFFTNKSFISGESQSIVQRDISMAASVITKELRYAKIVSNNTADFNNESVYYHLRLDDSKRLIIDTINRSTGAIINTNIITGGVITSLSFNLVNINQKVIMTFTISGNNGKMTSDYTVSSEVLLQNLKIGSLSSNSLYFAKP